MQKILGARAAVSIAVGLFITFTQSHSAATGLFALAIFGIGFAIANLVATLWVKGKYLSVESLPFTLIALSVGLFAALIPQTEPTAQALAFVYLVAGLAVISGALELYLANRKGFRTRAGKDGLISATLGLALGLLFLIAPLDIVSAVGFSGAYLVINGVHLGIAALTPQK
ncbi:unannotated protein [freshwater metagenome]|uniref:Unannotated protein n=1 Tax=freshwater metagenome TaxID=449393 RepID=A0A6J6CRU8_9ZZZZ|nr:hypothetical protein [Actinomycetota bacterium]